MTAGTRHDAGVGPDHLGEDVSSRRTLWSLLEHWSTIRAREDLLVFLTDTARPETAGRVTWERFAQDAWSLRGRLAAVGAADGRTLVLALPNAPLTLALWVAGQANGAAVHAVDPDSGVLTFARAIAATRPALVVAVDANAAVVADAIRSAGVATGLVGVPEPSAWSTNPPLEGLERSATAVSPRRRRWSPGCCRPRGPAGCRSWFSSRTAIT